MANFQVKGTVNLLKVGLLTEMMIQRTRNMNKLNKRSRLNRKSLLKKRKGKRARRSKIQSTLN